LSIRDELDRVLPVIYALRNCGKPLSIDTYKPAVMREALLAGIDMVNDISGFRDLDALSAINDSDCGICIMHMRKEPLTMQIAPDYQDVVQEVLAFLSQRVAVLEAGKIQRERICVDPGFGFGKALAHNLALLTHIRSIGRALNLPVLAGLSRKSMIGEMTGRAVGDRLAGSLGAAIAATHHGAAMLRVHDVSETRDALAVWHAATQPGV
jgi:dihydropteroate synthase